MCFLLDIESLSNIVFCIKMYFDNSQFDKKNDCVLLYFNICVTVISFTVIKIIQSE